VLQRVKIRRTVSGETLGLYLENVLLLHMVVNIILLLAQGTHFWSLSERFRYTEYRKNGALFQFQHNVVYSTG